MRRAVVVSDDSSSDGGSDDDVAREPEIDASESSEDDAGAGRGGLIDLEAEESGGSDDDDQCESETERASDDGITTTFHGFMQLPLELRYRIWEIFCPDLVAKGRYIQFDLQPCNPQQPFRGLPKQRSYSVREWVTLSDQTQPLRRVMAAHRESRNMAMKAFPETLSIDSGSGDALVHFHRHKDVVYFNDIRRYTSDAEHYLPGFSDKVLNVAITKWKFTVDALVEKYVQTAMRDLPNLKRIFFLRHDRSCKPRDLRWCVSSYVHQYMTETFEQQPGLGESTRAIACWPNVDDHPDFAKHQIPRVHLEGRPTAIDELVEERGIEVWPMVLFEFEQAMARYQWLQETKHIPNAEDLVGGFYGSSSDNEHLESEEDEDEDEDEYESEGIDDAEIIEDDESSEDEIIPAALSDGYSSADDGDDAGARFSSPELDLGTVDEDERDEPAPTPWPAKRRIVTDSDDDDDEQDKPRAKRARTGRTIMIDSDDEEDAGPAPAPVVTISDSEPDDDTGGAKTVVTNGESSSSEDNSDADDDSPPKQRVSLAERLRRSREAISIPSSDGEGDSADHEEEEEDEDEDDDEDEDEEDDSGDGLIDGMAAESDGEGEDESDEGW